MNLIFKTCELSDLECLTNISRQTFIDAFEKDNNPEDFKSYVDAAFNLEEIRKELLDENSEFYLIYQDDNLVAYFKLCEFEAQAENMGKTAIELSRIYVLQDFQGQTLGKQILQYIINIAKSKRKTTLWLGVWQKNFKAVRFYERHGFEIFNTHSFYIGTDQQTDWLMRLDLV